MEKKILIITGSPRRFSNSRQMAHWFADGAKAAGADVTQTEAPAIQYKTAGCTGCCGCQHTDEYKCVLGDGLAQLVETIPQYGTVVLATPVYFFGFPAQIKMILDRFMCLCKEDGSAISKTQFVLIASAGDATPESSGAANMLKNLCDIAGFAGAPEPQFFFRGCLNDDSRVLEAQQADLSDELYEFGQKTARES